MGEKKETERERLNRLAGEVQKFLELHHRIEPGTGTNDQPYDRKAKGSSRPPMSARALALSKANEEASHKITPVLGSLLKSHLGDPYANILAAHLYDPGALRTWRAGQTQEDREHASLFWEMCRLIARRIVDRWDTPHEKVDLRVFTDPKDAEADSNYQASARDRWERQREQEDEAKRKRAQHIREIQEREGCSERAAIGLWMDETQMSYPTAKRALEFVDGDDNGGEAA